MTNAEIINRIDRATVSFFLGRPVIWFGTFTDAINGRTYRSQEPLMRTMRHNAPTIHAFRVGYITARVADLLKYDLKRAGRTQWLNVCDMRPTTRE
jgi:hypothetical protein